MSFGRLVRALRGTKPYATRPQPRVGWRRAVDEAEAIVGWKTLFDDLKKLGDGVDMTPLTRLANTGHPLPKTIENLLSDNNLSWGLIVMLVSNMAGRSGKMSETKQNEPFTVMNSQRTLASVAEMCRVSFQLHNSMVNLKKDSNATYNDSIKDLRLGNKISLLVGDRLLSKAFSELTSLRNQDLFPLISSGIRDSTEAIFFGESDSQNHPLPSRPIQGKILPQKWESKLTPYDFNKLLGHMPFEWIARHVINSASLLGKSCQGALLLAEHPIELQTAAHQIGLHMALAWQACVDMEPFLEPYMTPFSIVSAPVMFTLNNKPSLYGIIEEGSSDIDKINYNLLHQEVLAGPALEQTTQLQLEHSTKVIKLLNMFPKCTTRNALFNIVTNMQDRS